MPNFAGVRVSTKHGTNSWVVPGSNATVSAWVGLQVQRGDFLQAGYFKMGATVDFNCDDPLKGNGKTYAFVAKVADSVSITNPPFNCKILTEVGTINPNESHDFRIQRCNGVPGQWCVWVATDLSSVTVCTSSGGPNSLPLKAGQG